MKEIKFSARVYTMFKAVYYDQSSGYLKLRYILEFQYRNAAFHGRSRVIIEQHILLKVRVKKFYLRKMFVLGEK